jgi:hypothetical protein
MKEVVAPRASKDVLVIRVDPLRVVRGRPVPRGSIHATRKHASRARSRRELARRLREATA